MKDPVPHSWQLRLQQVKQRLVADNFAAVVGDTAAAAARVVRDGIPWRTTARYES